PFLMRLSHFSCPRCCLHMQVAQGYYSNQKTTSSILLKFSVQSLYWRAYHQSRVRATFEPIYHVVVGQQCHSIGHGHVKIPGDSNIVRFGRQLRHPTHQSAHQTHVSDLSLMCHSTLLSFHC